MAPCTATRHLALSSVSLFATAVGLCPGGGHQPLQLAPLTPVAPLVSAAPPAAWGPADGVQPSTTAGSPPAATEPPARVEAVLIQEVASHTPQDAYWESIVGPYLEQIRRRRERTTELRVAWLMAPLGPLLVVSLLCLATRVEDPLSIQESSKPVPSVDQQEVPETGLPGAYY